MDRRRYLTLLAGSVAGAALGCGAAISGAVPMLGADGGGSDGGGSDGGAAAGDRAADASSGPAATTPEPPPVPAPVRHPVPGGAISVLPGDEPTLLIGLDDGINPRAIEAYCRLASDADLRLVMFGNGCYPAWSQVRPVLGPLVKSGRVQLANHTLDHPKLTQVSDAEVARQLGANARVFRDLYGVDLAPWFRPPYGLHDARVDAVAAAEGYHPPVVWVDGFADWEPMTTQLYASRAARSFQSRNVILAHLNKTDVEAAYPAFVDLIRERGLRTVTLDDVYLPTPPRRP